MNKKRIGSDRGKKNKTGNRIGEPGGRMISEALKCNSALISIDVDGDEQRKWYERAKDLQHE